MGRPREREHGPGGGSIVAEHPVPPTSEITVISDSKLVAEILAAALVTRGVAAEGRLLDDAEVLTGRSIVVLANGSTGGLERLQRDRQGSDPAPTVHVFVRDETRGDRLRATMGLPVRTMDLPLEEVVGLLDAGRRQTVDPRRSRPVRSHLLSREAGLVRELTPREREVLRELMVGVNHRDIAERLELAVGTVRTHVQSIRAKLGVSSVVEAVAVARRAGLRPPPQHRRTLLDEVGS